MATTTISNSGLVGAKYDNLSANNNYMETIGSTLSGAGGVTSVTFNNIPQGYKHLQLRTFYVGTGTYNYMQFNGDTGSNYTTHQLYGDGTNAIAGVVVPSSLLYLNNSSSNSSYPSVGIADILDYTNTNKYKTIRSLAGYDTNSTVGEIYYRSGLWLNTAAITSLTVTASVSFAQYSRISLYGIKG
jgi:hypothetical protein